MEKLYSFRVRKNAAVPDPGPVPGYVDLPRQYRAYSSYNCLGEITLRVKNKQTLTYLKQRFEMKIEVTSKNSSTILASRCNS